MSGRVWHEPQSAADTAFCRCLRVFVSRTATHCENVLIERGNHCARADRLRAIERMDTAVRQREGGERIDDRESRFAIHDLMDPLNRA